jgi:hypothetical protein
MATRALIRFAERQPGVSFSDFKLYDDCSRQIVTHQIYHHYDGAPDFLGVAIAKFIDTDDHNGTDCLAAQLLCKLKLGLHYDEIKCSRGIVYLEHPNQEHEDLDYSYYIWTGRGDEIWISIFRYDHTTADHCIFVGQPSDLIRRYKLNTNTNG